jgi:hypothetical protein
MIMLQYSICVEMYAAVPGKPCSTLANAIFWYPPDFFKFFWWSQRARASSLFVQWVFRTNPYARNYGVPLLKKKPTRRLASSRTTANSSAI